jgi:REP element-mobilizing transposase RayT
MTGDNDGNDATHERVASRPRFGVAPKSRWHRTYLPHWEAGELPQHIVLRLADSLPAAVLSHWKQERESPSKDRSEGAAERRERINWWLDQGHGSCELRDPRAARLVVAALHHFDGVRYRLHEWVVMPNHVHALMTPLNGCSLSSVVHSWKSYTAKEINRVLNRRGALWHRDYFDRMIRDHEHFESTVAYIRENPVKAGLCDKPQEWPFGSVGARDTPPEAEPG